MRKRKDTEWVHQLKQGDQQALMDLWELLYTWAWHLTRDYDPNLDAAHDAAQEAFWRILKRGVYQYNFGCKFITYSRIILGNEVNRIISKPAVATEPLEMDIPVEETRHRADSDTVHQRLLPCLDRLESRERTIIHLLYYEELKPQIVAGHLGISRNNTNQIACRARKSLHDCLQKCGYNTLIDLLSM